MKTTVTLRQNETRNSSSRRKRTGGNDKKSGRIDVVWILLSLLLVLGLLLIIWVFLAMVSPNGGT